MFSPTSPCIAPSIRWKSASEGGMSAVSRYTRASRSLSSAFILPPWI